MKNKLWALILYPISLFMSADWLDVNMPVGVTDISKEVFGLHMAIFFVVVAIGLLFLVFCFGPCGNIGDQTIRSLQLLLKTIRLKYFGHYSYPYFNCNGCASLNYLKKIYDHEAEEGGIDIQVVGWQWKWQYKYLDEQVGNKPLSFFSNLTTPPDQYEFNRVEKTENYLLEVDEPVVIPVDTPVRF
ncbi:MAG: hypothetical protein CM15mP31_2000 [Gammaproteobacteria bacterium]|nr:MAG: hypothetical protein CM15mP31_2000 [Gammaproteobacteria bacterium]